MRIATAHRAEGAGVADAPGPLTGVRVIDLGQWMAGPTAARLLADNGADVLRIDPPTGWRWSPETDAVLNRGKRRVTLDLDDAGDLAEAWKLVAESDIVIENFHPGQLERYGLDRRQVRTAHPSIIYLSLPGFASTDQEHAGLAAFEGVIAAATGQFADMGVNRVLQGVPASYSPLPLGSAYAGVYGAMAVGLALRARLRHGQGDHIEVPIASSLLEALAYNSMHVEDVPQRYVSRRESAITDHRAAGKAMDATYEEVQDLLDPFYRTYWCADGRPFYIVAVSHRRHPRSVLEVLGLWDEAVAAGLPTHDPYLPSAQWPEGADCTLLAHPISTRWSQWLSPRIAAAMATQTSAQWEAVFEEAGIPGAAHRRTEEWLETDHPIAAGLLVNAEDGDLGPTRQMGPVAWTSLVTDASQLPEPVGDDPVDADPGAGWLDGVTVVDMTNVIAGPTVGATLARFGARVIKVDLPTPTFDPWNTALCGMHANRGKESVLLDGRAEPGRVALQRLLEKADVVTVNASGRQLASLGLTAPELAYLAPRAVLCHLDAWGGPSQGPWSQRSGYDDLVQATTGIMARFGGGLDTPEEHAHFGTIDVLAGLCAAVATSFALHARDATGALYTARSSLAAAGQLIQAPYMCRHAGSQPHEPSGPQARGEGPTYRNYATQDGHVFVVIPDDRLNSVGETIGITALQECSDEDISMLLEDALARHETAYWRDVLAPLGVTVQPLRTLAQRLIERSSTTTEPWSSSSYHFTTVADHPAGRPVTLVAPVAVRPELARIIVPGNAPKYGAHTMSVLNEVGYSSEEILDMVDAGAAGLTWSDEYLPS